MFLAALVGGVVGGAVLDDAVFGLVGGLIAGLVLWAWCLVKAGRMPPQATP